MAIGRPDFGAPTLTAAAVAAAISGAGVLYSTGSNVGAVNTRPADAGALYNGTDPGQAILAAPQDNSGVYLLAPDSGVACSDAGDYICTSEAGVNWERQWTSTDWWRINATWIYVDPSAGSDTNSCIVIGSPCKTVHEVRRRFAGIMYQGFVLQLLSNLPSSDPLAQLNLQVQWNQTLAGASAWSGLSGNHLPNIVILGTRSSSSTANGTFTAVGTIASPSTNVAPQATDSLRTWTSLVGTPCWVTSGAANGEIFWPLKDLGSGVVRHGGFLNASGTAVVSTVPANGDTYACYTLPTVAATGGSETLPQMSVSAGNNANVYLSLLEFSNSLVEFNGLAAKGYVFAADKFDSGITIIGAAPGNYLFVGNYFSSGVGHRAGTLVAFQNNAFKGNYNAVTGYGSLSGDVFQAATITMGQAGTLVMNSPGAFDVAGTAVSILSGSDGYMSGPLYGSGDTNGIQVQYASKLTMAGGVPTISVSGSQLLIDNSSTAKTWNGTTPTSCASATFSSNGFSGWNGPIADGGCASQAFGSAGSWATLGN